MARVYQGEIRLRLGDRAGVLKIWNDCVGRISAGDPRGQMFVERIEQVRGTPR